MNVTQLDSSNFRREVVESDLPVLVDFSATWCGPCQAIAPALDKIAAEVEGSAKVFKVDADESPELLQQYGVVSVPTLILFEGGEETTRSVGAGGLGALRQALLAAKA